MVAQRISRFSVLAFLAIALWLFIFLIYYRYDFDDRIATYSNQPLLNPNHPAPPSAFVMLLRGRLQDAEEALTVLRSIEKQFNIEHQYPYVVFHENLSREAKQILENVVTAPMEFAQVNFSSTHTLRDGSLAPETVAGFGGKSYIGYRHMCRFFAGVITSHPALTKYRYIWRLDADARYFCPIQRDPFKVMFQHKKRYGYAIVLREEQYRAGHTLYQATQQFITDTQPKALRQLYRRRLRPLTNLWGDYNRCHFWNNLEILDLEFFRSRKWREYFEYLETEEGVWTERWGDALIRTLGVTMFLAPKEIEQFSDIGYVHHLVCVNPCGAAESCGLQHGDVYRQGHCSPWIAAWRPDDLAQLLLTDYAAWIYIVSLLTVLCFWMRKVKFWAWTMFCISCTLCLMF